MNIAFTFKNESWLKIPFNHFVILLIYDFIKVWETHAQLKF